MLSESCETFRLPCDTKLNFQILSDTSTYFRKLLNVLCKKFPKLKHEVNPSLFLHSTFLKDYVIRHKLSWCFHSADVRRSHQSVQVIKSPSLPLSNPDGSVWRQQSTVCYHCLFISRLKPLVCICCFVYGLQHAVPIFSVEIEVAVNILSWQKASRRAAFRRGRNSLFN